MKCSKRIIQHTLAYSDIFDFPLTKEELWTYLISSFVVSRKTFDVLISKPLDRVEKKRDYYFLKNREELISIRDKRRRESRKKISLISSLIPWFSKIPSILCLGISGGLALSNADAIDDIDVFVITKKNTVWITRLLILFLLELKGYRRIHKVQEAPNKICLNMIIDESSLQLPSRKQNLYTAHEIIQFVPLIQRNDMYVIFLSANSWVKNFLPNVLYSKMIKKRIKCKKYDSLTIKLFVVLLRVVEPIARKIQVFYMKSKITKETVTNSYIAFHPNDYTYSVLKKYKERIAVYE